ncbi:glycoprotein A33 (transmembrane), paralog a [Clarias gariepinus]
MILPFYFLFVVIHLTSSLNVDIPQPTYEFARGDTGVIPCNFQPQNPNSQSIIITWSAHPDNPADSNIDIETCYYNAAGGGSVQEDVSDEYTGRASVQANIPQGQAPLTLKSLTSQDSRVYQCDVKIPGDKKGKLSDTTTVVVLVAPSKPICAVQGTAEYYQNINLTCRSDEGTPTPTYKWQSFDVSNNSRPNPPKSTDVNGVLSLYNISQDTSGYYVCTSANKIRSATCNLTLSVMPPSMKIGSTAGIIGGCAAVLLLLIVVICCCYCRKKKKSEEYEEGPEEGGYTDKGQHELDELKEKRVESQPRDEVRREEPQGRADNRQYESDNYDERRSERYDDRRSDRYDDRRSDRYDDRRSDYDDRRNDRYDDRRSDYDDRRNDRYDDRRSDYDDRRNDRYDDRRSDRYDDRRSDYDDRRSDRYDDRYDDRRDRYDHPDDRYDDRSRTPVPALKPPVPALKPPRS